MNLGLIELVDQEVLTFTLTILMDLLNYKHMPKTGCKESLYLIQMDLRNFKAVILQKEVLIHSIAELTKSKELQEPIKLCIINQIQAQIQILIYTL